VKGDAVIIHGDARTLPLEDNSVDLIVTSPPYFSLRSYQDEGEHYDGQVGSEPSPQDFLEALWECTAEAVRVLKPGGSLFVNLGDKYAGSGGHNNQTLAQPTNSGELGWAAKERASRRGPRHYSKASGGIRDKSLLGLPWRYAIGCIDGKAGAPLILRAEIIWDKPNGIPESVKDRSRRTHEQWFHFTKEGRYFAAIDELRRPHVKGWEAGNNGGRDNYDRGDHLNAGLSDSEPHPLGAAPGSVWTIATEPLLLPEFAIEDDRGWRMFGGIARKPEEKQAVRAALWDYAERRHREGLEILRVFEPDHFAAFPSEWPSRLVRGWCPLEICTECGEGRRAILEEVRTLDGEPIEEPGQIYPNDKKRQPRNEGKANKRFQTHRTLAGYACACTPFTKHKGTRKTGRRHSDGVAAGDYTSNDFGGQYSKRPKSGAWTEYHFDQWTPAPTRPAVVLDIFGGTGTTALAARALGRVGISVDLSEDYCRLARWRIFESGHAAKVAGKAAKESQGALL